MDFKIHLTHPFKKHSRAQRVRHMNGSGGGERAEEEVKQGKVMCLSLLCETPPPPPLGGT